MEDTGSLYEGLPHVLFFLVGSPDIWRIYIIDRGAQSLTLIKDRVAESGSCVDGQPKVQCSLANKHSARGQDEVTLRSTE